MPIELYLDYISQPSRAVLAFCLLNKITVQLKQIRIAKLQHLEQNYEAVNPMKKVPAIRDTDNGLTIGESHAILSYLSRKFGCFEQFKPQGSQIIFAKVQEYLHYHHANTRKSSLLLYSVLFSKLYPLQQAIIPDQTVIRQQVEGIINFISTQYFKDSLYLIGNSITVADMAAFFEIYTLELIDFNFSKWQNITKWMKTMQSTPSIAQANINYKKMVPKMKKLRSLL